MKPIFPALAVALSGLDASAAAQGIENFEVETGLSTLGIYIAPKVDVAPRWQMRAPIYLGTLSDTFDASRNDIRTEIDGKITFNSVGLMADYKLGNAGFRLSGGVAIGGVKLEGSTDRLTLEGMDYRADFSVTVTPTNNMAPVLAAGFAGNLGENWGILAELGARITSFQISTTGQEALPAPARAQFEADLARVNSDLRDIRFLPFLTLGVTLRF